MTQTYSVILKSDMGEPIYLGDVLSRNLESTISAFEQAGCGVFAEDEVLSGGFLAANPRELPSGVDGKLRACLTFPIKTMSPRIALLANRVTIGRDVGAEVSYPIKKRSLESVSLEEAAVNLAIFSLSTRKLMTVPMVEMLRNQRFIDIEALVEAAPNKKAARAINNRIRKITTRFVKWMISNNAKLVKSKLPASLGVGTPSEVEGWNYGPTDGSEGLQFLPNATLVRRVEADQISFLQAIEELDVGLFSMGSKEWVFKELVLETLENLGDTKAKTCCPQASRECRLVCLADTTQRSATRKDVLGRDFLDARDSSLDEVSYNRMSLGCRQTAFMANPVYFMRVLLGAIHKRAISYPKKIDKYNVKELKLAKKEGRDPDIISPEEKARYLKLVPPSVRLNVLSDYTWELISPDLFKIFGGRASFLGEKMPFVQFYDYTKIPGRWPSETRQLASEYLGVSLEDNYVLPKNYHITFSFSGTKASLEYSEISNWAGQNTTFCFQTTSIGSSELKTLLDPQFAAYRELISQSDIDPQTSASLESQVGDYLRSFRQRLLKALKEAKIEGLTVRSRSTPLKEALPTRFMGYQVINGDFSDLRFLDEYQKINPEDSAIVGLKWKIPHGARFEVPDLAKYRFEKLSESSREKVQEGKIRTPGGSAQYTPFSGTAFPSLGSQRRLQEAGAAFAQFRLGMDIALDLGLDEPVRVFIIPKDKGSTAVRTLFTDVVLGSNNPNFTFSLQSGSILNEAQSSGVEEALDVLKRALDEDDDDEQ